MTDDYLMITDSINDAHKFVSALIKLSEAGLIKFNKKKLKANFPINIKDVVLEESQVVQSGISLIKILDYFQWVGIAINTKSLEVKPHYNCGAENVGISININIPSKRPRLWLSRKMNW